MGIYERDWYREQPKQPKKNKSKNIIIFIGIITILYIIQRFIK